MHELTEQARQRGIELLPGHAIVGTTGELRVDGVTAMPLTESGVGGTTRVLSCDLVLNAGGWTPSVHLFSQSRGKLAWDESIGAFVPNISAQAERSAGACRGSFSLGGLRRRGPCRRCGGGGRCRLRQRPRRRRAARVAGGGSIGRAAAPDVDRALDLPVGHNGKHFVDFQNDVTAADVRLAHREGYRSVEHLKRYTTMGMGTDQGKTSNINALGIMAEAQGRSVPEVGHTTFRPPYTPVVHRQLRGRGSRRSARSHPPHADPWLA